jgi:hypothetical protein
VAAKEINNEKIKERKKVIIYIKKPHLLNLICQNKTIDFPNQPIT